MTTTACVRILSLYLPTFATDLVKREFYKRQQQQQQPQRQGQTLTPLSDRPRNHRATNKTKLREPIIVLLTRPHQNQLVIAQCCERALQSGVRIGIKLSHARALLPNDPGVDHSNSIVQPLDDAFVCEKLHALTQWCMKWISPKAAVDWPSGILIDITGCDRLFNGEENLLRRVLESVRRLGIHARGAIASTIGCAWAVARYGHDAASIISESDARDAIASLPVHALRLENETIDALAEVGIDRIEHLLALRRSDLASRYGEDLLLRSDQALGHAFESLDPLQPDTPPHAQRMFAGPVKQLEIITLTVRRLIDEISRQLAHRESGVMLLELELKRVDAPVIHEIFRMSRPTRDIEHLRALIEPRVERINLGFGVEEIFLTARRVAILRHRQSRAWHDDDADGSIDESTHISSNDEVGQLIDTMAERVGWDHVQRAELVATHVPERSARLRSIASTSNPPSSSPSTPSSMSRSFSSSIALTDYPPSRRPTILFDPPERIEVIATTPDGPVIHIFRNGNTLTIAHSIGPERINAEWWRDKKYRARKPNIPSRHLHSVADSALRFRDYFFVVDDATGQWLWIFRASTTGEWFVHGEWA